MLKDKTPGLWQFYWYRENLSYPFLSASNVPGSAEANGGLYKDPLLRKEASSFSFLLSVIQLSNVLKTASTTVAKQCISCKSVKLNVKYFFVACSCLTVPVVLRCIQHCLYLFYALFSTFTHQTIVLIWYLRHYTQNNIIVLYKIDCT